MYEYDEYPQLDEARFYNRHYSVAGGREERSKMTSELKESDSSVYLVQKEQMLF